MKARNKKTGEIVEYYITNHYKTDEEFYFTKQDSAMNYGEFNELYEAIPQTGLGVNDDTSKKDDILYDPNHPYVGWEVETKCDCCGWDDNGYQHEPQCSSLKIETWMDRFDVYVNELRQETHWGEDIDSPTYYFGHKTQRPAEGCTELFTVTDWGNVKHFFQQELERIKNNFMTEFTDPDTGMLDIGKYDHERLLTWINNEIK